ncbi:MAG: hypothetical protein R2845_05090 [Thermomicrobiales bacterium]
MAESTPALTFGRTNYRAALMWLSAINVLAVLLLAVLGGRFFITPTIIDIHGYIANVVFLTFIGQAGLLFMSKPGGRYGMLLLGLSLVSVVLVMAQIGLGYSGRESSTALSLHIPNGVLICAIAAAVLSQLPYARTRADGA